MKKSPSVKTSKTLGLYIHIPFCKTICTYCAFLTFAHKNKWIPEYVEALTKEITEKALQFKDYQIPTIYFGGGTPSLIDSMYIEKIVQAIQKNFKIIKKPEISLEANPESLSKEKILHYQKIGINRISLGVQSLNAKTLKKVARPHNEKAVFTALENLREAQWKNFGCDLIMGLPYQTKTEFKQHVDKLLEYHPTHLSAYFLSHDTKKIDLFIKDCPQEEEQIAMYKYLVKKLAKASFEHYEVSNYALSGFQCQHNLRYWSQSEYLGLGIGAHSYHNQQVSENTRDFDLYLQNPLLLEESYPLDKDVQRMDLIMLSLRTKSGLDLNNYGKKYGQAEKQRVLDIAQAYIDSTCLIKTQQKLSATDQGFLIIDKITRDII